MKKSKRILTAAQAKALDKNALEKFGISTLVLMENAGRVINAEALKILRNKPSKVAIFCGTGNNGGDGFCAARHLLTAGIKPEVYLTGRVEDVKKEAKINLEIWLNLKQNIRPIKNKIRGYDLIIDALLGVGLKGQVRPAYREAIDRINLAKAYVLSVDIPSGLDATTGKVLGGCIKADKTVTFVAKKRGMVYGQGRKYCGKILIRDIGVPL